MSSGSGNLCARIGYADKMAIITSAIAKTFPIVSASALHHGRMKCLAIYWARKFGLMKRPSPVLVGLGLKDEVDTLGFAAADGDVLRLFAVRLMPGSDGVLAWRQVCQ